VILKQYKTDSDKQLNANSITQSHSEERHIKSRSLKSHSLLFPMMIGLKAKSYSSVVSQHKYARPPLFAIQP